MSKDDQAIEAEIQSKGLNAPRVTPKDIEANIAGEYFFTADQATKDCPQLDPGAISTIEDLCNENQYLEEMLSWAYGKLHGRNFINMEDALMADRIKLWLEHRIAG